MDPLSITLADGRRLAYAEYGYAAGTPVFYFHGSPGSRLEAKYADQAARLAGARIIAPDRPGYGASDFQRGRRFSDWPKDVGALADALGIETFAIVGLSGGAPHALACAVAMPDRVTRVAIVSGAGPIDAYIARSRSRVGRFFRRAGLPVVRIAIGIGVRFMRWSLRRTSAARMSTYPDRRVLARLDVREQWREDLLEGLRPGPRGAVHEFGLHTRPWPFAIEDVRLAVRLWHGEADVIVRADIGRYVAARLPECDATFIADEGHLLIVDHIGEVLEAIGGRWAPA
jgi:pimeloyl-ACP methyl ester carboxylesterase